MTHGKRESRSPHYFPWQTENLLTGAVVHVSRFALTSRSRGPEAINKPWHIQECTRAREKRRDLKPGPQHKQGGEKEELKVSLHDPTKIKPETLRGAQVMKGHVDMLAEV